MALMNPFRVDYGTSAAAAPSTFVPDASQGEVPMTPASSPWVRPIENRAPGLLQQTGQTLTQAGETAQRVGDTIGDRVQDTMDEAQTKQAETAFLAKAQDLLYNPDGGFLHQLGQNAIGQYGAVKQAVAKAAGDARAALTNPMQQRMFNEAVQPQLMNYGRLIDDHQFQQQTEYSIGAADARATQQAAIAAASGDSYGQRDAITGAPSGQYATARNTAIHEVLTKAHLSGYPPDSPQAQQMVKDLNTQIVQGVVTRMLDRQDFAGARRVLGEENGEINEPVYEKLDAVVSDGHMTARAHDLAAEQQQVALGGAAAGARQLVQMVTGAAVTSSPADGKDYTSGVVYAAPPRMAVKAAADGTVESVQPDGRGAATMVIRNADGSTMTVGGLGAFNYSAGDRVSAGQAIGVTGRAAKGVTGLAVSMTDANGQPVDPRAAAVAPRDPNNFTDPNMLAKAIDGVNATGEPQQVKDIAINRLKADYATATGIVKDQQSAARTALAQWQLAHPGMAAASAPASIRLGLSPEDQLNLRDSADTNEGAGFMVKAGFIRNPETLTPDNVDRAFISGAISRSEYLGLSTKAQEREQNLQKATVDSEQFKSALIENGLGELLKFEPVTGATKEQNAQGAQMRAQQLVELNADVRNRIVAAQQAANRPLTYEQQQQVIDQTMRDRVFVDWNEGAAANPSEPIGALLPAERPHAYVISNGQRVYLGAMPQALQLHAAAALRAAGRPVTAQAIGDYYTAWEKRGSPRFAQ
ncbi:MAG TPA: M23 family metallopeptidase [Terracidiphilus sp.]|nr:M23 family metallopeptidase [Terracidiphilus sp.]